MRLGSQAGVRFRLGSLRSGSHGIRTQLAAAVFSSGHLQNYFAPCSVPL